MIGALTFLGLLLLLCATFALGEQCGVLARDGRIRRLEAERLAAVHECAALRARCAEWERWAAAQPHEPADWWKSGAAPPWEAP